MLVWGFVAYIYNQKFLANLVNYKLNLVNDDVRFLSNKCDLILSWSGYLVEFNVRHTSFSNF